MSLNKNKLDTFKSLVELGYTGVLVSLCPKCDRVNKGNNNNWFFMKVDVQDIYTLGYEMEFKRKAISCGMVVSELSLIDFLQIKEVCKCASVED